MVDKKSKKKFKKIDNHRSNISVNSWCKEGGNR